MNNKIKLSALLMASALVHVNTYAAVPFSDPNNTGNWVINNDVSDEFSGNSLDLNKWKNLGTNGEYYNHWKGRAPSQFNSENVSVKGGFLTITSRWDENFKFADEVFKGNGYKYGEHAKVTSAAIVSKNMFKYGYMEIRAKAAEGPISSSFWMTGKDGEIDVFEAYGQNSHNKYSTKNFHSSIYDWRVGSDDYGTRVWTSEHQLDFNMSDGFHVYGFEWDPSYIKMFVDGVMVNCKTKEELGDTWTIYNEQRVWIDSETFNWEVDPRTIKASDFGSGQEFIVDYSRIWQRDGTKGKGCPVETNVVKNGDFESGLQAWRGDGVRSSNAFKGNAAGRLMDNGTIEQTVTVKPNTTYVLTAWANSSDTNETNRWFDAYLGVKNYGKAAVDTRFFFPRYHDKSIQFTTGPNNNTATIFFTNDPKGGDTLIDEVSLVEVKKEQKMNPGQDNGDANDDIKTQVNLLNNKGFERGFNQWRSRGHTSIKRNHEHWGNKAVLIEGVGAVEQRVSLKANSTYRLSGWGKVSQSGESAYIGIKGAGGQEKSRKITSTGYERRAMTFTTGPTDSIATIYYWSSKAGQKVYADDFQLVIKK